MGAEGIRVEFCRKPGYDRAMIAAIRNWRKDRRGGVGVAPLLLVGRPAFERVVDAAKSDPVGESILIVGALAFTTTVVPPSRRNRTFEPWHLDGSSSARA